MAPDLESDYVTLTYECLPITWSEFMSFSYKRRLSLLAKVDKIREANMNASKPDKPKTINAFKDKYNNLL
jgi:hypothetical protein